MQNTHNSSRRDLLRKVPLLIGSAIGLTGLVLSEANKDFQPDLKLLSENEGNNYIQDSHFSPMIQIKPEPAPKIK